MSARERILARIRAARGAREGVPHPGPLPPGVLPGPAPDDPSLVLRTFAAAVKAAGGEVHRFDTRDAARRWLEGWIASPGDGTDPPSTAAVGTLVPEELRPGLPAAEPRDAALGVSMAVGGAADTGSLLLDSRDGRRAQVLPPAHLVWVEAARIEATLGTALERAWSPEAGFGYGRPGEWLPPALALHSGPSKSADIGGIVVTGVHGPGRFVVGVVGPGTGASGVGR